MVTALRMYRLVPTQVSPDSQLLQAFNSRSLTPGFQEELLKRISTIESMLVKINPAALEQSQLVRPSSSSSEPSSHGDVSCRKLPSITNVTSATSPPGQHEIYSQNRSSSISTSDSSHFQAMYVTASSPLPCQARQLRCIMYSSVMRDLILKLTIDAFADHLKPCLLQK